MDTRRGGQRYCPSCKKVVETRVLLEGYSQTQFQGIPAKKRPIICGTEGTLKVQTDAERNGSRWRYLRSRF